MSQLQPLLENHIGGSSHYLAHGLQTMCVQFMRRQVTLHIQFFNSEVTAVYELIRAVSEWRGCTLNL